MMHTKGKSMRECCEIKTSKQNERKKKERKRDGEKKSRKHPNGEAKKQELSQERKQ